MKLRWIVFLTVLSSQCLYSQQKGLGVGIIVGQPTGINGKAWLSENTALNMGLAWNFDENAQGRMWTSDKKLQMHADYLIHNFSVLPLDHGKLPVFYGLGARMVFDRTNTLGLRMPVGLDYLFQNTRMDMFIEIVPILDLIPGTAFDINGVIGARFWIQ